MSVNWFTVLKLGKAWALIEFIGQKLDQMSERLS